jgi:glycosyltransferase involved in cell wall biosynthesis
VTALHTPTLGTEATRPMEVHAARRLLVVTYSFPSDGLVGGLRWAGLTKYLARQGWNVAVLTAAPAVDNEPVPGVRVESCPRLWTVIDALRFLRRPGHGSHTSLPSAGGFAHPPRVSAPVRRLYEELAALLHLPDESRGWVARAILRARSLIRRFEPHVVVSSGPPHSAHLVAAIATIESSARWLIDLRDPWAGPFTKAWESDPTLRTWVFRGIVSRLERAAFRTADGVITNNLRLAEALAVKYPEAVVTCVPNGVDPERLPRPADDPYPGLGIVYAGTLYGSRDLGPVVRALRIFFEHHPAAACAGSKLRIAGLAEPRHALALRKVVAEAGLGQHVEVLGRLGRAQALEVVSRSRLAVVLAQEQELQVPAKLYESVAMGIPTLVLATAGSAAVEGSRLGALVCDPSDMEGIACVLEQLWQDDSRQRWPCPVPISYEAIAPVVDELLRGVRTDASPGIGVGIS